MNALLNKKTKQKKGPLIIGGIIALLFAYVVSKDVAIPSFVMIIGAMIGGGFLFTKSMKSPIFAFYAMACYLPFSKILTGDFGGSLKALNFTNILMIFVLMGMMAQTARTKKPLFGKNSLNILFMVWCIIAMVSIVRGFLFYGEWATPLAFIVEAKRWITPITLFYLAFNALDDRESIKNAVRIMIVTITVVGLMATYDYINVGVGTSLDKARIGGIAEQPNQLAAFFVYYMFYAIAFFLMQIGSFRAWSLLIPIGITLRGLQVTFSRGGYLAFAVGLLALTFFRNKVLFFLAIVLLVLAITNPAILPEGVQYRLGQTVAKDYDPTYDNALEDNLESSSAKRIEIWKTGWEMIKDKPILGWGYQTFRPVLVQYRPEVGRFDAHNSYIILAAEMGMISPIIFLIIIAVLLRETLWLYKHTDDLFFKSTALGMLGSIFALLFVNIFGSRLITLEISGYFYVFCGIILKMKDMERSVVKVKKKKTVKRMPAVRGVRG